MRHFFLTATALLAVYFGNTQTVNYRAINNTADSLYRAKRFDKCGQAYWQAANLGEFKAQTWNALYNAACCYALSGLADSAMALLHGAVKAGYTNRESIEQDNDLSGLRMRDDYKTLLASLPESKSANANPAAVELITADVHRFWQAYDKAKGDSALLETYMREIYFGQASKGMEDYFALKLPALPPLYATCSSIQNFMLRYGRLRWRLIVFGRKC